MEVSATMKRETVLQRAAAAIQAGRLADGAALCRQLLATEPGQPEGLHLLAMATRASDPQGAEALFRESLARAPHQPAALVNFANFLRTSGRVAEAESLLRRAIELAPEFVPAWYNLGVQLRAAGRLDDAARCATRTTRLSPSYAAGWELQAAIDQQRGDLTAAIAACRTGLRHSPNATRLHYSLGQLLREDCAFEAAAESYDRALALGFDTPDLHRNRSEACLEAGDLDRALAALDRGVARYPRDARLHRLRASLHQESGAPGDSLEPLWRAARTSPDEPALWQTLVDLLGKLGRRDEADAALAEARERGCVQTPDLLLLEALRSARGGDVPKATASMARLVGDHPQHTGIRLAFAEHLLTTGDPARAEAVCADALDANPLDQLAWAYRGTAWQLLDDPRAGWLLDYERMVMPIRVDPPADHTSGEAFYREVLRALEALHRTHAHPIEQTVRGGTQTNGYLFRLKQPVLRVLEEQIRSAVAAAVATFPDDARHPFWGRRRRSSGAGFRFSGCWSVRLTSQGFHVNHIHPAGWISSALYVAVPDEVRDAGDRSGHIQFGVPPIEMGVAVPPQRIVAPRVGQLLLFPSYMWHGTVPFTSPQPRVTVAFDLVPHG